AEQARDATELFDAVDLESDDGDARLTQAICRRFVVGARVEHDEVRPNPEHGLDVRADARAETRYALRRIGEDVVLRSAHEPVARADREEDLGGRRVERDDPLPSLSDVEGVAEVIPNVGMHARRFAAAGVDVKWDTQRGT